MANRIKEFFDLDDAIRDCIAGVAGRNEQAYTAKLVTELPQKANAIFKAHGFGFGGAFIHQRPCVTPMGESKGCELGDLLVFCHRIVNGKDRYNAQLLQLKKVIRCCAGVRVSPTSVQYRLYADWPKFRFTKPALPGDYDIYPKAATPGALYSLIEERGCGCLIPLVGAWLKAGRCIPQISVAGPEPSISTERCLPLAANIIAMMDWRGGRPICRYDELTTCSDEWSKLIWNLLWATLGAKFTCTAAGFPVGKKGDRTSRNLDAHLKWLQQCAQAGQKVVARSFEGEADGSCDKTDNGFGLLIIDEQRVGRGD